MDTNDFVLKINIKTDLITLCNYYFIMYVINHSFNWYYIATDLLSIFKEYFIVNNYLFLY